jgi:hypothetical protein
VELWVLMCFLLRVLVVYDLGSYEPGNEDHHFSHVGTFC